MKKSTIKKARSTSFFDNPKIKKIMSDPKRRASIEAKSIEFTKAQITTASPKDVKKFFNKIEKSKSYQKVYKETWRIFRATERMRKKGLKKTMSEKDFKRNMKDRTYREAFAYQIFEEYIKHGKKSEADFKDFAYNFGVKLV